MPPNALASLNGLLCTTVLLLVAPDVLAVQCLEPLTVTPSSGRISPGCTIKYQADNSHRPSIEAGLARPAYEHVYLSSSSHTGGGCGSTVSHGEAELVPETSWPIGLLTVRVAGKTVAVDVAEDAGCDLTITVSEPPCYQPCSSAGNADGWPDDGGCSSGKPGGMPWSVGIFLFLVWRVRPEPRLTRKPA